MAKLLPDARQSSRGLGELQRAFDRFNAADEYLFTVPMWKCRRDVGAEALHRANLEEPAPSS